MQHPSIASPRHAGRRAFTLIELAIVLVIIGLIVGGALVGRDLIAAAIVRSQITQINQMQLAARAFMLKYNAMPGDMKEAQAFAEGFTAGAGCDGSPGYRDGDGLLDGGPPAGSHHLANPSAETGFFWTDLASTNMITGGFPANGAAAPNCQSGSTPVITLTPGANYVGDYYPMGKISGGIFLYVYEQGGFNWYGLSAITGNDANGVIASNPGISVMQAFSIDSKLDDGLPQSGTVMANYLNNDANTPAQAPNNTTDDITTCYNSTTPSGVYSTGVDGGVHPNCALSFRFQ